MPKAPRRCQGAGGTCTNMITHTPYCPDHTVSWAVRGRPSTWAWRKQREHILERDSYHCHLCGGDGATQVDHIIALSQGGTDHPTNLAAAHKQCNELKGRTVDRRQR